MTETVHLDHEAIVVGAGVGGIYQIKRLVDMGVDATVLEAASDLGGTWHMNRYPGARFDSESYTYGYSFSKEVLAEWHWREKFSPQPENLRYLNFVADKFDLRQHMQFNCKVEAAHFDDATNTWRVRVNDGRTLVCRFLIMTLGLLSIPTMPKLDGIDDFKGAAFHTFHWPHQGIDLRDKRVAIIGTGATAIQVIGEIQDKVGDLTVFQRRPNWCAPLNNTQISEAEMAEIRARYDDIFAACARSPGGFEHEPDRRGFHEVGRAEREALWEELYNGPGFGIWLGNFREILMDDDANAEMSAWVADRIRERVHDPETAETLIPKDHGFGVQRVPMETNYLEAYNRPNVHLVDISKTPLTRATETGLSTTAQDYEFDVIIYATGFDAITGAYDLIDLQGANGVKMRDKWRDRISTYLGVFVRGFPNMIMPNGPQSGSASSNYPRGIETGVNWVSDFLARARAANVTRVEASEAAEDRWTAHVEKMYEAVLMRKAKSWFTGYNSNVEGHEEGTIRYLVYNGGMPKYVSIINSTAAAGYPELEMSDAEGKPVALPEATAAAE